MVSKLDVQDSHLLEAALLCRFFTYLLYLFLLHTLGISMFRFVAALCRNETVMAVVGSAFFLVLILLGGFLLSAGQLAIACHI